MFESITQLMPVATLFMGALLSLSLDFKSVKSKVILLAILTIAFASLLFQVVIPPIPANENVVTLTSALFMMAICVIQATIILINGEKDFKDENVERFYYVLSFMVTAGIVGFLYMDNIFLIGVFIFIACVFLVLLNFIYPKTNKRALNILLSLFTTGFVFLMIGSLILLDVTHGLVSLSSIKSAALPLPFYLQIILYTGTLIIAGVFPAGILLYKNMLQTSHISVKILFLVLISMVSWKTILIFDGLGLLGGGLNVLTIWLGIGSVVAGIVMVSRAILSPLEKRVSRILVYSLVADFGLVLMAIGYIGNVASFGTAALNHAKSIVVLQIIVILLTRSCFIATNKNLKLIFGSDMIEEMGGIKASRPVTLAGYLAGTTGSGILGIFVLDGIYTSVSNTATTFLGIIFFWTFLIWLFFTIAWATITASWIFGGKDIPVTVKKNSATFLKRENATVVFFVVGTIIMTVWLSIATSLNFITFLLPLI
ncbi:MAG: hypothetical protein ACTSUE_05345 [Promethearchaeota archaeon]